MAQRKNKFSAIPLQSFDIANLTAAYQSMNGSGLPEPCAYIRINNTSNTAVTISYDGVTDHDFLGAESELSLPLQANAVPSGHHGMIAQGTIVYIKGATGGSGNIYLSGYYQEVA